MRKLIFVVISLLAVFNLISAYTGYIADENGETVVKELIQAEEL